MPAGQEAGRRLAVSRRQRLTRQVEQHRSAIVAERASARARRAPPSRRAPGTRRTSGGQPAEGGARRRREVAADEPLGGAVRLEPAPEPRARRARAAACAVEAPRCRSGGRAPSGRAHGCDDQDVHPAFRRRLDGRPDDARGSPESSTARGCGGARRTRLTSIVRRPRGELRAPRADAGRRRRPDSRAPRRAWSVTRNIVVFTDLPPLERAASDRPCGSPRAATRGRCTAPATYCAWSAHSRSTALGTVRQLPLQRGAAAASVARGSSSTLRTAIGVRLPVCVARPRGDSKPALVRKRPVPSVRALGAARRSRA